MHFKMLPLLFLVSVALQILYWSVHDLIDTSLWINQAKFFLTDDPQAYSFDLVYAIPGGPFVLGVIAFTTFFAFSYEHALQIVFVGLNSIVATFAGYSVYQFRKSVAWGAYVTFLLSFHPHFSSGTPPSILATSLLTLLFFTVLNMYEERWKPRMLKDFIFLGALVGFIAAVRIDIGLLSVFLVLFTFFRIPSYREWIAFFCTAFTSFCIWNPFMWRNPFEHTIDLGKRLLGNYTSSIVTPIQVDPYFLVTWSLFPIIAITLSLIGLRRNDTLLIPKKILYVLLSVSVIVLSVFVTSKYQAIRYLTPLVAIWESLIPLYLGYFISEVCEQYTHKEYWIIKSLTRYSYAIILMLLCSYPILTFIFAYLSMAPYR